MSEPNATTPARKKTLVPVGQRMAKAFYAKTVENLGGCWDWVGRCDRSGYPKWPSKITRETRPHRWAYERAFGPIPFGKQIDHLCRNRRCVNPEHMEAVAPVTNTRRGIVVKLSPVQIAEIKWLSARETPPTRVQLADHYGVTGANIRAIAIGISWRDIEPAEPSEPIRSMERIAYRPRQTPPRTIRRSKHDERTGKTVVVILER